MQIGAFLGTALGTQTAIFAIIVGSVLGAALLGWVAHIGFERGLSSPILMCQTLGTSFAKLPVILNIIQLIGWSAFELVVMRDGTTALIKGITGIDAAWIPYITAIFWGMLLVALATGSMIGLVRRFVGRFGFDFRLAGRRADVNDDFASSARRFDGFARGFGEMLGVNRERFGDFADADCHTQK